MPQVILLVLGIILLVSIFYLGLVQVKKFNNFVNTEPESNRQKVKIKKQTHFKYPPQEALFCHLTKKCDDQGCENGKIYGVFTCKNCKRFSDDALWSNPCPKCGRSRKVKAVVGKCKKCQGIGFLSFGPRFQVADADFPEKMKWDDAMNACRSLGDGWRLPAKEELKGIYNFLYKNGKGNFLEDSYWSSSEKDASYAWVFNFKYGKANNHYGINGGGKNNTRHVRAVRTLP